MEELELYNYKKKRSFIIFIMLIVLMVAINVVVAVFTLNNDYYQAFAKVIDVDNNQITYEFNLSSDKVCRQVCEYDKEVSVGDTIVVYYHKTQTSMVKFSMDKIDLMLIILSGLIELIVIVDYIYISIFYRY